jgi:hypothetical protein
MGVSLAMIAACGGDDGNAGGTTESPSSSTDPSSTNPSTTQPSTTTPTSETEDTSSGSSTTMADSSSTADSSGSTDDTGTSTAGFDCTMIPAGPFTADRILMDVPFGEAEDLGFDGQGHLAARGDNDEYLLVSADGTYEDITSDARPTYGLRFLANGDLVAAAYTANDILRITPAGDITDFASDLGGVNGLFPDSMGGVWYTNFGVVGYVDAEGNDVPVVNPAANANGVFFDEARQAVFFTNYGSGGLFRADIVDGVAQPAADLGSISGNPDGITLDVCGNLYVNDQGNSEMYRVFLDEAGDALGEPEELVDGGFPTNVANAQFGSGDGWAEDSLYAIGVEGGLYEIAVGVPGAPYVTVR